MIAVSYDAKLNPISRAGIVDYFYNVDNKSTPEIQKGSDHTRIYEVAIVCLVVKNDWNSDTLKILDDLIKDPSENENTQYAAFYALCTYYRRKRLCLQYRKVLEDYRFKFDRRASYRFLDLMCIAQENPLYPALIDAAANLCAREKIGENYGVWHFYGEAVAEQWEALEEGGKTITVEHIDNALRYVERAIDCDNKAAIFYCTLGRLQMIRASYSEEDQRKNFVSLSKDSFNTAMKYEVLTERKTDFALRRQRAQTLYYSLVTNENIKKQEAAMEEKIKDISIKNIEILSVFTAVITLLFTGSQMLSGRNILDAVLLMATFSGGIVILFAVLGVIIHGEKGKKMLSLCIYAGILLIVIAVFVAAIKWFSM